MTIIRRVNRFIINHVGAAAFDAQWLRDTTFRFPLLDDETGVLKAATTTNVVYIGVTARTRPNEEPAVGFWQATRVSGSAFSEFEWAIAFDDMLFLEWELGERRKSFWIDMVAVETEGSVLRYRPIEDANGNFVFPFTVTHSLLGVPD